MEKTSASISIVCEFTCTAHPQNRACRHGTRRHTFSWWKSKLPAPRDTRCQSCNKVDQFWYRPSVKVLRTTYCLHLNVLLSKRILIAQYQNVWGLSCRLGTLCSRWTRCPRSRGGTGACRPAAAPGHRAGNLGSHMWRVSMLIHTHLNDSCSIPSWQITHVDESLSQPYKIALDMYYLLVVINSVFS